jgi:hypothetical protein
MAHSGTRLVFEEDFLVNFNLYYNVLQHIDALPSGLQIKKTTAVHSDLFALVQFYSNPSQKDLPCALRA